jgi:uncharacterized protein HemX
MSGSGGTINELSEEQKRKELKLNLGEGIRLTLLNATKALILGDSELYRACIDQAAQDIEFLKSLEATGG